MYCGMYVLYAYIRVCMHLCVYACMYICMHVRIHVCMYAIFKLGFEQYGRGNCPSWEGELSGGIVWGEMSVPLTGDFSNNFSLRCLKMVFVNVVSTEYILG